METPTYIRVAGIVYKKATLTAAGHVQSLYNRIDNALFGTGEAAAEASFQEIADYLAQSKAPKDADLAVKFNAIMQKYMDAQRELADFYKEVVGV
jgi:hypothetical protein